jgi:hypothetical protein
MNRAASIPATLPNASVTVGAKLVAASSRQSEDSPAFLSQAFL